MDVNPSNVEYRTFYHTSSHWRLHEVTVKGHTVSGNTTRPALETWGIQQLDWAQRLRGGGVGGGGTSGLRR